MTHAYKVKHGTSKYQYIQIGKLSPRLPMTEFRGTLVPTPYFFFYVNLGSTIPVPSQ